MRTVKKNKNAGELKTDFKRVSLFSTIIFAAALFLSFLSAQAQSPSTDKTESEPKVRNVFIKVYDIFENDFGSTIYKTVNNLKIGTKERIVYQELLLKEGDTYSKFLLEESERALRQLAFLRKVTISPSFEDGVVDLLVEVQDTWTLFPQVAYSIGGGDEKRAIGVSESNLLGYGKRVEFLWSEDDGRESLEAIWDDSRLFGSKKTLLLGYFDTSDGFRAISSFAKPFRSLVEKSSWQVQSDFSDLVGRLFEFGDESFIYRQEHNEFGFGYTVSSAELEETSNNSIILRYTFGYSYVEDNFTEADEGDFNDISLNPESVTQDPELLADDRKFSGPFFSLSLIEADFLVADHIDSFERPQDFNMGYNYNLRLQFAGDAFGSKEDTLLASTSLSKGFRYTDLNFLRAQIESNFRLHDSGFDDFFAGAEMRYFHVLGAKYFGSLFLGKHTFASSFKINGTSDLDRDDQIVLGAENGLRGYENKAFVGEASYVFNVEDRFSFSENVFQLFNLGGAFFFDAGAVSDGGFSELFDEQIYSNIGIGLRVGLPRSSGGTVLRIDLGIPLRDGPDGSEKFQPQLILTSGQVFSGFLDGEQRSLISTDSVIGQ